MLKTICHGFEPSERMLTSANRFGYKIVDAAEQDDLVLRLYTGCEVLFVRPASELLQLYDDLGVPLGTEQFSLGRGGQPAAISREVFHKLQKNDWPQVEDERYVVLLADNSLKEPFIVQGISRAHMSQLTGLDAGLFVHERVPVRGIIMLVVMAALVFASLLIIRKYR